MNFCKTNFHLHPLYSALCALRDLGQHYSHSMVQGGFELMS